MKVAFRTDSSLQMGSGHVMRCLTLADALRAQGVQCHFISREHPGHLLDLIRQRGHRAISLPAPVHRAQAAINNDNIQPIETTPELCHGALLGCDWETDAAQTADILVNLQPDWLVVDSYTLDARWEKALRPHFRKLMVIDDLADRPHDADLLLDQNLHQDAELRYRSMVPGNCRMLLGPSHVLLRPQFDTVPARRRDGQVRHVFVYFGGNDLHNQAGRAIAAIARFTRLTAQVVLGPGHPHRSELLAYSDEDCRIKVVENCADMAGAMGRADLALGVCGVAAWERCALGLPTLVCVIADNQREDAENLHRLGAVECLGDDADVDTAHWHAAIHNAIAYPERVVRMGAAARAVVAGHEVNRMKLLRLLHGHDD